MQRAEYQINELYPCLHGTYYVQYSLVRAANFCPAFFMDSPRLFATMATP